MKTIIDFLSFLTTFPTAIAHVLGPDWTAQDVYHIGLQLQKGEGITNTPYVKPMYANYVVNHDGVNPNRLGDIEDEA